jgi:hypothetical protein
MLLSATTILGMKKAVEAINSLKYYAVTAFNFLAKRDF